MTTSTLQTTLLILLLIGFGANTFIHQKHMAEVNSRIDQILAVVSKAEEPSSSDLLPVDVEAVRKAEMGILAIIDSGQIDAEKQILLHEYLASLDRETHQRVFPKVLQALEEGKLKLAEGVAL